MRKNVLVMVSVLMVQASSAVACSLCGTMSRNNSLAFEFEQANVIVYGHIANPKLTTNSGGGTTEFHVNQIIKDSAGFPRDKMLLLSRYLPILDPKSPPKFVMFFHAPKKSLQPYWGKEIAAPGVLNFVAELQRYRNDRGNMLLLAAKHFDDADQAIADEAFMVFAKADDKLIAGHAKKLDPTNLRKLIKAGELEPERLSMFAYLLGACGKDDDADLLRSILKNPQPRDYKAFEGIMAGYLTIRPREGWAFLHETLKSDKQSFLLRYAALRTMRFFYNANSAENWPRVSPNLALAIVQPDLSDIAIQDLLKWKRWEHTKLIVSCWDRPSHRSAIVKQSIVRYAIACPQPEARVLLDRARRQDPELVRDLEAESRLILP